MPRLTSFDEVERWRQASSGPPGRVPRIIHQTWKSASIPAAWQRSSDGWQRHHPGWAYVLWTDAMNDALVDTCYPEWRNRYRHYPHGVQRADLARVLYLHRYGGVYSDLDIEPNLPFDPFVQGDAGAYLFADGPSYRFTNMLMAGAAGDRFWERLLRAMENPRIPWWAITRHFRVQASTGPLLLDRVVKSHDAPIGLWPGARMQPCSNCDRKPCTREGAYTTMLEGGSWGGWDSVVIRAVACAGHRLWRGLARK